MGEYFVWVNATKKEYLDEHACDDFGWMFSIASLQPCALTEAACSLVNGPWRGDAVMFAGDYLSLGECSHHARGDELLAAFGNCPYDARFVEK